MKISASKNWRSVAAFAFDLGVVAVAWVLAWALRFNFDLSSDYYGIAGWGLLWLLPFEGGVFMLSGLYRGIWVFASLPDLLRMIRAIAISMLVIALTVLLLSPSPALPRSVFLMYPVLLLLLMGGGRTVYRVYKEYRAYGGLIGMGKPVLVLGSSGEAANLVRQLSRSSDWHPVGVLTDDASKLGREMCGVKILGPKRDLAAWAHALKVRHAIIAMPGASRAEHREVANLCVRAGVKAYTLPDISHLIVGHDEVSQMRRLNLEDLLGRDAVTMDLPPVQEMLAGRVVMVTGAGGSIGSELCRQIARFKPACLLAFDASEFALYRLVEECREWFPDLDLVPLAGDVRDAARVDEVVARHRPSIIFHAAAYKHVPLMEEHNAWQAMRNNVFGTWVVAQTALRQSVERFVMVSTDKAVNPTNVMGASKRLAEIVCQTLQGESTDTRFEIVRFGNVLGSNGSVIPKFQAQIERGGPVTVTHPEITRYFMAISEAAQLVLVAAGMGKGGEIFVLDMGQPIRVADLARDMVRLSGYDENEIKIVFTGLRPGEKLYEEVLADREVTLPTPHPKLRVARACPPENFSLAELLDWLRNTQAASDQEVRRDLRRWVPEYQPYNPPQPKLQLAVGRRQA